MNIWRVIAQNLGAEPVTLHFPERAPTPDHFRGAVQLNPEHCLGCATCAYVCAPGAIRVTDYGTHGEWSVNVGRCTFCGRCADVCPTHALALAAARPPIYAQPDELEQVYRIAYPPCPECGQPALPLSEAILARAFGEVTDAVREASRLCMRCRQRRQPLPTKGPS
jgi:ferredoxin